MSDRQIQGDNFENPSSVSPVPARTATPPPLPAVSDIPFASAANSTIPYASFSTGMQMGVGRDGKLLVVPNGCSLGPNCVLCNAPSDRAPKVRTIAWYPPWILITALIALLVTAILILVLQKKVKVAYTLCARHRSRRLRLMAATWLMALACPVTLMIGLVVADSHRQTGAGDILTGVTVVAVLALLVGAIITGLRAKVFTPKLIRGNIAVLKGGGAAFLDGFANVVAPR